MSVLVAIVCPREDRAVHVYEDPARLVLVMNNGADHRVLECPRPANLGEIERTVRRGFLLLAHELRG